MEGRDGGRRLPEERHGDHGGGQYVAFGPRGTIVTSANGTQWTERETPTTSGLESVAFGIGRFVAAGFKGTIMHSVDGVRWLTAKSGTKEWLNDVIFGGGMFVAVGTNGTLLTSADRKAWVRRSSGTEVTLGSVAFGDRRFVVVGRVGLILESGRLVAPPVPPMLSVTLANGSQPRLIIAGQQGQLYRVEVSTDLRRWKVLTLLEGAAEPVEFVDESTTAERDSFYRTVTP